MNGIAAMIVAALALWHSPEAPRIEQIALSTSDPYELGYAVPMVPDASVCGIGVTGLWEQAPEDVQRQIIVHEVGHCLLYQYGYYDHFPWDGVMSLTRRFPTDDDLAGLAAARRAARSRAVVRVAMVTGGYGS